MAESLASFFASTARAPKISVLIPTYNYARYLPQAIESVLAQKFADYEILISDDASTDDSAQVIRHYAKQDSRIGFALHSSNLGMVANWNWCLQQARGEYVKFVFGDDLLTSPHALARLSAILDTNPTVGLAASARLLFDGDSKVTGQWDDLSRGLLNGPLLVARCLRTRRNLVGEPSTVMFRRSLAHRGFDPAYRQIVDLEMWFHLLMQSSLSYTSEPLCGFRRHSEQQTVSNSRSRVTDLELVSLLERYLEFPTVREHLPPHGWAYRRILFRQMHYARKAKDRPRAAIAVAHLEIQLPLRWRAACWVWHRLARPGENLLRKLASWKLKLSNAISPRAAKRRATWKEFLHALPSRMVLSPCRSPDRQAPPASDSVLTNARFRKM